MEASVIASKNYQYLAVVRDKMQVSILNDLGPPFRRSAISGLL